MCGLKSQRKPAIGQSFWNDVHILQPCEVPCLKNFQKASSEFDLLSVPERKTAEFSSQKGSRTRHDSTMSACMILHGTFTWSGFSMYSSVAPGLDSVAAMDRKSILCNSSRFTVVHLFHIHSHTVTNWHRLAWRRCGPAKCPGSAKLKGAKVGPLQIKNSEQVTSDCTFRTSVAYHIANSVVHDMKTKTFETGCLMSRFIIVRRFPTIKTFSPPKPWTGTSQAQEVSSTSVVAAIRSPLQRKARWYPKQLVTIPRPIEILCLQSILGLFFHLWV